MPLPFVVIDLGPPPIPPALSATLVAACSDAIPSGHCVLRGEAPPAPPPGAFVTVTWQQPEQLRAELRIVLTDRADGRPVARVLSFREADAPTERWRAAGYAIGALVGAHAPPSSTPQALPAAPGPPAAADSRPADDPVHLPLWFGVGGETGPGLTEGNWRFGGWLRTDYTFETVPLLLSLAGSYAVSPEDDRGLSAGWLGVGAGGGVHWTATSPRLELRFRAELRAERLTVTAFDGATGLDDQGSRWSVGPAVGVDVTWPSDRVVAAVAGVSAWSLSDETGVELGGERIASAPWAGLGLKLGVRLGL